MAKVMISLPEELLAKVDAVAQREQRSRSAFVRQALEEKLARRKRQQLQQLLAEGYRETARSSQEITEDFMYADVEDWPDYGDS